MVGEGEKEDLHELHRVIADRIDKIITPRCKKVCVKRKSDNCGGTIRIPLLRGNPSGEHHNYCEVDYLVLKNDEVRLIIEVEEKDRTANRICGKILASTLTDYFHRKTERDGPFFLSTNTRFIQVVKVTPTELKVESMKINQWDDLRISLGSMVIGRGKVTDYWLLCGEVGDFEEEDNAFDRALKDALGCHACPWRNDGLEG